MTTGNGWEDAALSRVRDRTATVAIVGCGYVGLTLAVEAARAGLAVLGIEANETRAKQLRAGVNPIRDVILADGELTELTDAGTLSFATTLDGPRDVYVVCVNTPLRDGSPDLRYIEEAGASIGRLRNGA